jgi:hypothetical protein
MNGHCDTANILRELQTPKCDMKIFDEVSAPVHS